MFVYLCIFVVGVAVSMCVYSDCVCLFPGLWGAQDQSHRPGSGPTTRHRLHHHFRWVTWPRWPNTHHHTHQLGWPSKPLMHRSMLVCSMWTRIGASVYSHIMWTVLHTARDYHFSGLQWICLPFCKGKVIHITSVCLNRSTAMFFGLPKNEITLLMIQALENLNSSQSYSDTDTFPLCICLNIPTSGFFWFHLVSSRLQLSLSGVPCECHTETHVFWTQDNTCLCGCLFVHLSVSLSSVSAVSYPHETLLL